MNKTNTNLEVYQASMNKEIESVKDKVEIHKSVYLKDKVELVNKIVEHENDIQDHEIRIVVLEKSNGNK